MGCEPLCAGGQWPPPRPPPMQTDGTSLLIFISLRSASPVETVGANATLTAILESQLKTNHFYGGAHGIKRPAYLRTHITSTAIAP